MLFAHAPAGWLLAYICKQRSYLFYGLAMLGALTPDFDLFYYYLFDASVSHRQFISHSLLPYLGVLIVGIICLKIFKQKKIGIGICLFSAGALSHILFDAIGVVAWFYPISQQVYGLAIQRWFSGSGLGRNLFALNSILELIIIWQALILFFKSLFKTRKIKIWIIISGEILFVFSIILVLILNQHLIKGNSNSNYADYDQDGVLNKDDRDFDGDQALNISDLDTDGDGVSNKLEIYFDTQQNKEVWYDLCDGGCLEILLRIGLVTDSDYIRRIYEQSGIFFRAEMTADYQRSAQGYHSAPTKSYFERDIENWKIWLKNQNKLISYQTDDPIYTGDILFMSDHSVALVYGSNLDPEIKKQMAAEHKETNYFPAYLIVLASKIKGKVVTTNPFLLFRDHGNIEYIGRVLTQ